MDFFVSFDDRIEYVLEDRDPLFLSMIGNLHLDSHQLEVSQGRFLINCVRDTFRQLVYKERLILKGRLLSFY